MEFARMDAPTVSTASTVGAASRLLTAENVGSVVVVDERRRVVGIVTDRDVVSTVQSGRDLASTPVEEVLSPTPTVSTDANVAGAVAAMAESDGSVLPVVTEEGRLRGVITLDDLLVLLSDELQSFASEFDGSSPED
jgi:CBS domain-containing protein